MKIRLCARILCVSAPVLVWPFPVLAQGLDPDGAAVAGLAIGAFVLALGVALYFWRRFRQSEQTLNQARAELSQFRAVATLGTEQAIFWTRTRADSPFTEQATPGLAGLLAEEQVAASWLATLAGMLPENDRAALVQAVENLHQAGTPFSLECRTADDVRSFSLRGESGGGNMAVLLISEQTISAGRINRLSAEAQRLNRLLHAITIPVWLRDDAGQMKFANNAYRRAVDADELLPAEDLPHLVTMSGDFVAGDERAGPRFRKKHIVIDGQRRYVEAVECPLPDIGVTAGFAIDHTDLEETQAELSRLVTGQDVIMQSLGTAIALYGSDQRLQFFNNAYLQLWGLDEAWLRSGPTMGEVLELLRERRRLPEHADFPAHKREQLDRFMSLIEPREEMVYLPDGTTLRSVAMPHPLGGLLLLWEDVTDTLALERNYNTLIAVQRETLDNLFEGVAVIGANGRLRLCNPAFGNIWKIPAQVLENEPHISEIAADMLDLISVEGDRAEALERMISDLTRRDSHDGRIHRIDGTILDFATVPLPDGAVLLSYHDVTAALEVETALRERNEALETADRLKTEFINNVSYELRTPLNSIIGFTEILTNRYFGELNPRQSEYIDGILESSDRLRGLINDILDLATIEAGQMSLELEKIDLAVLLNSVIGLVREMAKQKYLDLEADFSSDIGLIEADSRRLKQVLYNILSNAIKFTPQRGRIILSARRVDNRISLSVTDTGIGISDKDRDTVFETFARGAGARGSGAGLGLALVKTFVELHGGEVSLEHPEGGGTRVVCTLPGSAGQALTDSARAARPSG